MVKNNQNTSNLGNIVQRRALCLLRDTALGDCYAMEEIKSRELLYPMKGSDSQFLHSTYLRYSVLFGGFSIYDKNKGIHHAGVG